MSSIGDNVRHVREEIAEAALRAGAAPESIKLVAASKTKDAEAVREAVRAGVDACGENRVNEFLEKDALGAYDGAPKHFIGRLQQNKVRQITGRVDLIQSVDSAELLQLIEKRALALPENLTGGIRCRNPRCITSAERDLPALFKLTDREKRVYRCVYCEAKYEG